MQGKVEICGVNTARLKVLSQQQMDCLLLQAKNGDESAKQRLIYTTSHIDLVFERNTVSRSFSQISEKVA